MKLKLLLYVSTTVSGQTWHSTHNSQFLNNHPLCHHLTESLVTPDQLETFNHSNYRLIYQNFNNRIVAHIVPVFCNEKLEIKNAKKADKTFERLKIQEAFKNAKIKAKEAEKAKKIADRLKAKEDKVAAKLAAKEANKAEKEAAKAEKLANKMKNGLNRRYKRSSEQDEESVEVVSYKDFEFGQNKPMVLKYSCKNGMADWIADKSYGISCTDKPVQSVEEMIADLEAQWDASVS